MSAQEAAVNGQDVSAFETHDGDPPDAGGSQLADDVLAVGDEGERTEEEPLEVPPETTVEAEKPEPTEVTAPAISAEELKDLRDEVAKARQWRDEIKEEARVNPEFAKFFGGRDPAQKDYRGRIDSAIDESFAPADGKALKGALAPLFEELADLRRQVGRADSTASRTASTQAQRDYRAALVEAKVPVDNPAFVKLQRELRNDSESGQEFREAEARNAGWARRAAIDAWFASAGRKAVNGDDRARIQAAKGGRTGGKPAGNAATAERVIRIPWDPHRQMALMEAADKAGKPRPRFEWIEEKEK